MTRGRRLRGAGAIEFALTLPFLLLVTLGIVELSLLMHRTHLVTRAARDACRTGSLVLEGPEPTGAEIEAAATAHALFALQAAGVRCAEGCTVRADWYVSDHGWHLLKVAIDMPYEPISGIIPGIPRTTHGTFVTLTQQQEF